MILLFGKEINMWFNESNEEQTKAVSLKPAKSGKGWVLTGEVFDVFLWNNSKTLGYLLEACITWVGTGQAPTIVIVKNSAVKAGYELVPEEPTVEFVQGGDSFHWKLEEEPEENPFLKKKPSPSPTGSPRKR